MQPGPVYLAALVASAVLLVATCAGWTVDRRVSMSGQAPGVGGAFLVVFGVAVSQSTGFALMSSVVTVGAVFRSLYEPIFVPYLALSVVAVGSMLAGQGAGVVSRSVVRGQRAWMAIGVILTVVSLSGVWLALRLLLMVQHIDLNVSVFFAPTAAAAVLTALMLARAVAFVLVSPRSDVVATEQASNVETIGVTATPRDVALGQPDTARGGVDTSPFRRPPTA